MVENGAAYSFSACTKDQILWMNCGTWMLFSAVRKWNQTRQHCGKLSLTDMVLTSSYTYFIVRQVYSFPVLWPSQHGGHAPLLGSRWWGKILV